MEGSNCISPGRAKFNDLESIISASDVVFISGPMTGYENYNRVEFARMESMLNKHFGCSVLNPGRHGDGHEYEWYMARCAEDIHKCTMVVFLDGWAKSPGARREFKLTHKLQKAILFASQVEIYIRKGAK